MGTVEQTHKGGIFRFYSGEGVVQYILGSHRLAESIRKWVSFAVSAN